MNQLKMSVIALALIFNTTLLFAQIGINNVFPDSSSVLDMSGGANSNRGVLFPNSTDLSNVSNPAHGLLIFNNVENEYYFKNDVSGDWQSLNRVKSSYGSADSYILDNLGIGKQTPDEKLDVLGNVVVSGNLDAGAVVSASNFEASGDVNIYGKLGKIKEHGNALVPRGTIVMWNGNSPPAGWAICDGKSYLFANGAGSVISTPDLRGRFIVGKTNNDASTYSYFNSQRNNTNYNAVTKFGGSSTTSLAVGNLPAHGHNFSGTTTTVGSAHGHIVKTHSGGGSTPTIRGNQGVSAPVNVSNRVSGGAHTHTFSGTSQSTGSGTAINNIPPYYVLAFIMKL